MPKLEQYQKTCEQALESVASECFTIGSEVSCAAKYALLGGGKRVRGVLVLAVCEMLCGNNNYAEAFSAAIEMIHAFSLVHDDLPCMDDDDIRRGKPSTHIAFGEATALLAGDALCIEAFGVVSKKGMEPLVAARAAGLLACAAGARGMIYGQELDLRYESEKADAGAIDLVQTHKTGALIKAAAGLGVIAAGREIEAEPAITEYADCLGKCFQIVDDILDVTANEDELGKPIGSDIASGKTTFVTLFGLDKAQEAVRELTEKAVNALRNAYNNPACDFLCNYAKELAARAR